MLYHTPFLTADALTVNIYWNVREPLFYGKYWFYFGLAVRVFANDPRDRDSTPGRVIPKTQKMVLHASVLNIQHYNVWIKGEVGQSREKSRALPYISV